MMNWNSGSPAAAELVSSERRSAAGEGGCVSIGESVVLGREGSGETGHRVREAGGLEDGWVVHGILLLLLM